MVWQTVDSIPKDGSEILLVIKKRFLPASYPPYIAIGHYWIDVWNVSGVIFHNDEIIAWMPLPTYPSYN